MKKTTAIGSSIIIPATLVNLSVHAQTKAPLLSLTQYQSRADLDVLFANSDRVLEYLEGEEIDRPLFLSLITAEQEQKIKQAGLKPQILDDNADLSRYVLLWHPQPDQSVKLSQFGEVFQITAQHTLLKLPPDQEFVHTGVAAEFFEIPFGEVVATPPLRTKKARTPTPFARKQTESPASLAPAPAEPIVKPTLFLLLYFGIGVILFFFLRNKAFIASRKRQLIYFFVLLVFYFLFFLLLRPDIGADIRVPPSATF